MILVMLAEAAQQVATVVPHVVQAAPAAANSWDTVTLGNVAGAGSVLLAGFMGWIALDKRRRETAKEHRDDTDRILGELGKVNSGLGERVKKLETKTHDFMTRAEINGAIEHEKGNRGQADRVLETWMTKIDTEARSADRRITTLEEKSRSAEGAISELKSLIKESNAETKALIREFAEENKTRFDQVCDSIREVREVRSRS